MAVADVSRPVADYEADEVLRLLREQVALYTRLESFADRQRMLVSGDDPGRLLPLLADRQKLSLELRRVATRLEPVRRNWSGYRARLTPPQRREADHLLNDARARLGRVIEGDERDARILSVRKEAAAQTLRAIHSTGQAITAYREPAKRAARLDCTDEGERW